MTWRRGRWMVPVLLTVLIAGAAHVWLLAARPSALHTVAIAAYPSAIAVDPAEGRAVVYSGSGVVTILDVQTGSVIRTLPAAPYLRPTAVAIDGRAGLAFVAGPLSLIQVLETRTGRLRRVLPAAPALPGNYTLGVDEQRTLLLLADQWGRIVRVFAPRSGRLMRTVHLAGRPVAIAVDARRGHALVALDNRTVVVLDELGGHVLHTARLGHPIDRLVVDETTGHAFAVSQFAGTVTMMDVRTGTPLRTMRVGVSPLDLSIDAVTGRAFVSNVDSSTVSVLDTRSGTVLRMAPVATGPRSVVTDERDRLVFVTTVDPTAFGIGPGHDSLLDALAARLHYVPPGSNIVDVLDARTGATVTTFRSGLAPLAIGVDAPASRVLVATTANDGESTINIFDAHSLP